MTARPCSRAFPITLAAVLIAAMLVAGVDVALAARHSADPLSAASWLAALAGALGLYGGTALLLGVAAGGIASAVASMFPAAPHESYRRWRDALRTRADHDLALASGFFAAGAAALVVGAIVFVYARAFGFQMANRRNAALSTAMVAVAALPVAAIAWFPFYRLLRWPTRVLPRPRVLWAIGVTAMAGLAGGLGAVFSVDWRVLNFGPVLAAVSMVVLAVLGGVVLYDAGQRPPHSWRSRLVTAPLGTGLLIALIVAAIGAASYSWLGLSGNERALVLLGEETSGARPLLALARRMTDRDHDGFAYRFGGGDCNDHDPAIHPGAEDIPGDGSDQDCSGSDAEATPQVAAPTPPRAPSAAAARLNFKGNFLFITIDTLRADRVGPRVMPHLDAWAKDAAIFTRAYAQAPNTPRSFPSFLTSRFPSQISWVREFANFSPLTANNVTFFQTLRDAGWHTVGVFSHFYTSTNIGIDGGFDVWDNIGALTLHDSNTDIAAPRITPRVVARLRELAKDKRPFALWTHYFEPHSRYMEHAEFPAHSGGAKGLEEKYDGEVAFVDLHLEQIFSALRETGLDQTTAVVVFSDHGEAFGEHRFGGELMYFHGQTLYEELLHIPLLIKVPGVAGRRVTSPVMLIDLGPTIVELAGTRIPAPFRGRSLVGGLLGEPLDPVPVYAELLPAPAWNHSWRAYLEGDRKLIYKISENSLEMYDLGRDPTEQRNLAQREQSRAASLKEALLRHMTYVKNTR